MTSVPHVSLSAGSTTIDIPQLGFGVWQVPDAEVTDAVATALEVGYRSIDTAAAYEQRGRRRPGARRAPASPREELFVTTKVWNDDQGYDATLRAFDASAKRLGHGLVDLYLIHWPRAGQGRVRRHLAGAARAARRGPHPRRRCLQLPARAPAAAARRDRRAAGRQPDRAAPAPAAARAARLPRRSTASSPRPGARWPPAASCSTTRSIAAIAAAPRHAPRPRSILRWHLAARQRRHPQVGDARRGSPRTSTSSTSSSTPSDLAAIEGLDRGERTGPDPDTFNVGA